jgi:uncharacterized protein (TIGR02466 family)
MIEHNYNIFPVLLKRFENFLTPNECIEVLNRLIGESLNDYGVFNGNVKTSFNAHVGQKSFTLDSIEKHFNIKDKLQLAVNQYAKDYGSKKLKLSNSWMNVQYPDSKLKYHTHHGSVISGTLYLNVDDDSSGICFLNPNPFVSFIPEFSINENATEYSSQNVKFMPTVGDLILFPSWLTHGSDQTNQSKERIVLSFNAEYEQ